MLSLLIFPLFFLILSNQVGFRNILNEEVKIFSDPGLINTVNSYQGAAKEEGLGILARISENRYIFSAEYILLKYIKSLTPATFFTSQEKLLGFSFSPPIYLGFVVPFFYGLYQILQFSNIRKILLLSALLIIPSVLAKPMVDLNRLILFLPVVIFVMSYGFIKMIEKKGKKAYLLLILTIAIIFLQLFVTISDIRFREKDRFIKYYGQNYELGKQ